MSGGGGLSCVDVVFDLEWVLYLIFELNLKKMLDLCKEQAPYAQFSQEEQGLGVGMGTEDRRIGG